MAINNICIPKCNLIKGIPLAFDDSLSYLEQICAIISKLNDTITQVNKNTEWISNYEGEIDAIKKTIDDINIEIDSINSLLETKVSKEELNNAINALDTKLTSLIQTDYQILKEYVDIKDENLQYQIDNFEVANIKLLDPTTGLISPLQVVIYNIYDQTREDAILAQEFDDLELTATEFDEKEISAFDFDSKGKILLTE